MKRLLLPLCLLLFLLGGCARTEILPVDGPAFSREIPAPAPRLNTGDHIAYMSAEDGLFRPEEPMRRGQACRIFFELLETKVEGSCSFSDIGPADDCYEAVACLAALGVVSDSEGPFDPEGLLSHAQLVTMLEAFYPIPAESPGLYVGSFLRRSAQTEPRQLLPDMAPFSDISGHWAEAYIQNAAERGWVRPGGPFLPDVAVTRAEFCQLLNRVLGRQGDPGAALFLGLSDSFSDVPTDHPAYADILEAAQPHEPSFTDSGAEHWLFPDREPGFHRVGGRLFYVQEDGSLLRSDSLGLLDFDEYGRYTSGLAETDEVLARVLVELGTDDMEAEEALLAAYEYCVFDKSYIRHPWPGKDYPNFYQLEHAYRARRFLDAGGGTCYDFAAAFGLLARSLGFNAYIVHANINKYYAPHGWVVIPEDGTNYIYDPEMEATRLYRHSGTDLFHITNHSIYHYWYSPWWDADTSPVPTPPPPSPPPDGPDDPDGPGGPDGPDGRNEPGGPDGPDGPDGPNGEGRRERGLLRPQDNEAYSYWYTPWW